MNNTRRLKTGLSIWLIGFCLLGETSVTQVKPSLAWTKNVGAKTFHSSKKIFIANNYGAISDTGLKDSDLQGFNFNVVKVNGNTAGDISYGKNWKFTNVIFTGADGKKLNVAHSINMMLEGN